MKIAAILLLGLLAFVSSDEVAPLQGVSQGTYFQPEQSCNQVGGFCLLKEECPEGAEAPLGLCPSQQSLGVECCRTVSILEKRCQAKGGICRTGRCPSNLLISAVDDCPSGSTCCALV